MQKPKLKRINFDNQVKNALEVFKKSKVIAEAITMVVKKHHIL